MSNQNILGKLVYEAFRKCRKSICRWEAIPLDKQEEWESIGQKIRLYRELSKPEAGKLCYFSFYEKRAKVGSAIQAWDLLPREYQNAWIHVGEVARNWVETIG